MSLEETVKRFGEEQSIFSIRKLSKKSNPIDKLIINDYVNTDKPIGHYFGDVKDEKKSN